MFIQGKGLGTKRYSTQLRKMRKEKEEGWEVPEDIEGSTTPTKLHSMS